MAGVSGAGRSSLNPNAPLFIPAAFQQVEDFSPEWWELVKTSTWFRDHWFRQHQEQENFDGDEEDDDIANLLPESFDLGITDEFSNLEAQLDAVYQQSVEADGESDSAVKKDKLKSGDGLDAETLVKNLSLKPLKNGVRSSVEPAKYFEKPVQSVSPKPSPRRIIQQPR